MSEQMFIQLCLEQGTNNTFVRESPSWKDLLSSEKVLREGMEGNNILKRIRAYQIWTFFRFLSGLGFERQTAQAFWDHIWFSIMSQSRLDFAQVS